MGKMRVRLFFVILLIFLLSSVTKQQGDVWAESSGNSGAAVNNTPIQTSSYKYFYDKNGRLQKVESGTTQFIYTYDANGNLLSKARSGEAVLENIGEISWPAPGFKGTALIEKSGQMFRSLNVSGWYLSSENVDKVEVYMDSNFLGTAKSNIENTTIYKKYPEYKNKNSGFAFQMEYGAMKNLGNGVPSLGGGTHLIEVYFYTGNKVIGKMRTIYDLTITEIKVVNGRIVPVEGPKKNWVPQT